MIAVPQAWMTRATSRDREAGCDRREEGAGDEEGHRQQVDLAGGKSLHEETGDGNDDGHGEEEASRQPLRGRGADVEICHERRQGNAHDRLVENDHERRDDQDANDEAVPRGDLVGSGSSLRHGAGGGQWHR